VSFRFGNSTHHQVAVRRPDTSQLAVRGAKKKNR
jgi:hypothetical protein